MPGPLPRAKSNGWWNRSWAYRLILLRELSSVFVAAYIVLLLVLVSQVRAGEGRVQRLPRRAEEPAVLDHPRGDLGFAQLHTSTWFRLTPKALALKLGGKPVPPELVILGNYVIWAGVSIVVLAAFLIEL